MKSDRGTVKISRRRFVGSCCCTLAAGTLAASGLLADSLYDTRDIQATSVTVAVPGLATAFDGLTITQISDLHIHTFGDVERRLVSMLQGHPQQLIAITGDFVDDDGGIDAAMRVVKSLHAEFGIWGIPGNVDYYGDYDNESPPPIFNLLRQAGVHFLTNEHAPAVQRGNDTLYLLGVDDPVHGFADIGAALQGMPDDASHILLAHSPDIVEYDNVERMAVALVGHTHGGQIRLPLVPPAVDHSGPSMVYNAGMYQVGPTQMYVNRGIGTSHIPLRFACQPEITYIRLVAG